METIFARWNCLLEVISMEIRFGISNNSSMVLYIGIRNLDSITTNVHKKDRIVKNQLNYSQYMTPNAPFRKLFDNVYPFTRASTQSQS